MTLVVHPDIETLHTVVLARLGISWLDTVTYYGNNLYPEVPSRQINSSMVSRFICNILFTYLTVIPSFQYIT